MPASERKFHAVGGKPANPWDLYDMHGNVWEWTASLWKGDYSQQADGLTVDSTERPADLAEPHPRDHGVIRGGSYWNGARGARLAYRNHGLSGIERRYLGFRVLLPFPPSGPRAETIDH